MLLSATCIDYMGVEVAVILNVDTNQYDEVAPRMKGKSFHGPPKQKSREG